MMLLTIASSLNSHHDPSYVFDASYPNCTSAIDGFHRLSVLVTVVSSAVLPLSVFLLTGT